MIGADCGAPKRMLSLGDRPPLLPLPRGNPKPAYPGVFTTPLISSHRTTNRVGTCKSLCGNGRPSKRSLFSCTNQMEPATLGSSQVHTSIGDEMSGLDIVHSGAPR